MELNEKMGLGGFDKQEGENCHTAASRTTGADRRKFLTALAAFAGNATAARAPRGHIDVHHHFFPPAALDRVPYRRSRSLLSAWTPQEALAEMDANHVATAIASIPMPVWLGDVQASRSLARKWNEYSAQLVRDHPERFGFFASVPLPDAEGSLREISYALDVLKADGIILMTNYEGKYPGDAPFAPVLDELNHRKAVVFFHPTNPNAQSVLNGVPAAWAELPHDTTRAVLSLLVSGSFARLRDIRFIFSHAGGTLPMLAGRITLVSDFVENIAEKAPNGIEDEFKRLYYDIAAAADRSAMAALRNLALPSRIMFGSDYPVVPIAAAAGGMTRVGLSAADLQAIGRENAVALFPRLKVSQQ